MSNFSAITERIHTVFSDEEQRWWRSNVFSSVILFFCIAMAFAKGHSYFRWCVPVFYAFTWSGIHRCNKLLGSMITERSSPDLVKLSSELRDLMLYLNMTVLTIGIFCVGLP